MATPTREQRAAVNSIFVWKMIEVENTARRDYYKAAASVDACAHVAQWACDEAHVSMRMINTACAEAERLGLMRAAQ